MIGSSSTSAKHTYNLWGLFGQPIQGGGMAATAGGSVLGGGAAASGGMYALTGRRQLPVAHPAYLPVQFNGSSSSTSTTSGGGSIPPAAPQSVGHRAQPYNRSQVAGKHPARFGVAAVVLAVAVAVVAALAVAAPEAVALAVAAAAEAVPSVVAARPSVARRSLALPAKAPKHRSRNIRSRSTTTSGSSSTTQWKIC